MAGREIIEPSAFHSTRFDELRAVIDHKGVPLATYPRTLQLEDRSDGLHWSLDPPKSRADVIEAIQRGDMRAGSWRMRVAKDRWDGDTRHVEAISDLFDVTLVGAELPAYPAAAIEYRSQPNEAEPAKEETAMAEQAGTQQQQETDERSSEERRNEGGLNVEDRVEVIPIVKSFMDEVATAAREVSRGEVRSLTTAISLSNPQYSDNFFDLLRPQSAFLRSGARTLTTQSASVIYPMLTTDAAPSWYAEGGTIAAVDPALGAGTAAPHKLAIRVEYSNELADDSSPALEPVLRQTLTSRAAIAVDVAAYEGQGANNQPKGMGLISGIGNVNASAANTSYLWAGSAVAYLEAQNAPRPYAFVGGSALVRDLRQVVVGTATPRVPPASGGGDGAIPTLYGAAGYMTNGLAGGTAYVYSPSSCYLINRTAAFDVEINRARLFDSDRSELRLKARLDYLFPYPGAICRGTAVP